MATIKPFNVEQFTATKWATAADKAKWANDMASWVSRGFPVSGWRKGLYDRLHVNLYGHIAEFNMGCFYDVWFANSYKQLSWMKYVLQGGHFGIFGDPDCTWSDVERAFQTWLKESGLVEKQQESCSELTKQRELAQLAALKAKYEKE